MPKTIQKLNPTSRESLKRAFLDKTSFGTTLLVAFLDQFGFEATAWDPETIRYELRDELQVSLSRAAFDRLMTAIAILTTDNFYQNLPDFIAYCNVLSGDIYDPTTFDPAEVDEIAWGITEALLISPPDDDEPFTEEIRAYIGAQLDEEGIMQPPDVLKIAMREFTGDMVGQVQAQFSDDPEMFGAIYDVEQGKTDEINQIIRGGLQKLLNQLSVLNLNTGSVEDLVSKLSKFEERQ